MAGQGGFEPTTPGFGDRCSTNWSYWPSYLFHFFVSSVRLAPLAIFLQLHFGGLDLLIASFAVVSAFAIRALQLNDVSHTQVM